MTKQKTNDDAREALKALGLNPDAPALDHMPERVVEPGVTTNTVTLAPPGVDPHTMPVSDIVFDPALLDGFPSLDNRVGRPAAARYVFDLYKQPRSATSKDRNRRLQDEIGLFILRVRRSREPGSIPHVKEQIRREAPQRDLLALLSEHGITSIADLERMLGGGE